MGLGRVDFRLPFSEEENNHLDDFLPLQLIQAEVEDVVAIKEGRQLVFVNGGAEGTEDFDEGVYEDREKDGR